MKFAIRIVISMNHPRMDQRPGNLPERNLIDQHLPTARTPSSPLRASCRPRRESTRPQSSFLRSLRSIIPNAVKTAIGSIATTAVGMLLQRLRQPQQNRQRKREHDHG